MWTTKVVDNYKMFCPLTQQVYINIIHRFSFTQPTPTLNINLSRRSTKKGSTVGPVANAALSWSMSIQLMVFGDRKGGCASRYMWVHVDVSH